MIFISGQNADQLHKLFFKSVVAPNDVQFINDRAEGKALAIHLIQNDKEAETLYFKKGERAAKMIRSMTGCKIKHSRDEFLRKTLCPAVITNVENINAIAEALVEL